MASTAIGGAVPGFGDDKSTNWGLRQGLEAAAAAIDRLQRVLLGPRQPATAAGLVAGSALAATAAAMVLLAISATLHVPGGWGIEDFLGWVDPPTGTTPSGPAGAIIGLWKIANVKWLADLYLLLDTLLFIPLYSLSLLALADMVAKALAAEANVAAYDLTDLARLGRWRTFLMAPVVAVMAADLVENAFGLTALEPGGTAILAGMVVFALVLSSSRVRSMLRPVTTLAAVAGVIGAIIVVVLIASATDTCKVGVPPRLQFPDSLGCAAHRGKQILMVVVTLVLLVAIGAWLFAALRPAAPGARERRAEVRTALWDIVVRSRYVLATLAVFAGLTLGLDQARDVMYAVAAAPWPRLDQALQADYLRGSLLVYALACIGVWSLAFACWLWTRSVCLVIAPGHEKRTVAGIEDTASRLWARFLGLMPYLIVALLCFGVLRDCAEARYVPTRAGAYAWIMVSIAGFAATAVVLGLAFVRVRVRKTERLYYNAIDWTDWASDAEFIGGWLPASHMHKYRLLGVVTPYLLPFVAMAFIFVARALDLYAGPGLVPSMAFVVIVFTLTLWLCFFGWLSILEVVRAVPWVLLLLALVGVLAFAGVCDNQRVWSPLSTADGAVDANARYAMLLYSGLLGATALVAYAVVMRIVAKGDQLSRTRIAGLWLLLAAVVAAIIVAGDHFASSRKPLDLSQAHATPTTLGRQSLPLAMARWLVGLCREHAGPDCESSANNPDAGGGPIPVYFVSTEGGGIRAAAWTAAVLQKLATTNPTFETHTFSISGVSGGAVGAAAFRACGLKGASGREKCLDEFARTDLVTPLLSAWLFEDVLAKVIPTAWCTTPGCGFLSRSAWFEQSMESNVPGLRQGLWASRGGRPTHVPYLLLNSTWVESGERAIASDLQIDASNFPGAKDQLALSDHDLPLGTAAHNAARFPYVNAIGELTAPTLKCDMRDDMALHQDESQDMKDIYGKRVSCGHLADGGYFDNSGGQSSIDAMNGLVRCLSAADIVAPPAVAASSVEADPYAICAMTLKPTSRHWLRQHVLPTLVFIRNGVDPQNEMAASCARPEQPTAKELQQRKPVACGGLNPYYHPERPACRRNFNFYVAALGPPLALFNGGGTGAHGRLSEASQRRAVVDARIALRSADAMAVAAVAASSAASSRETTQADAGNPLITLDQSPDGIRYPLGWHLSGAAVDGLHAQAKDCSVQ